MKKIFILFISCLVVLGMATFGFAQKLDPDTIKKCGEWKDMAAAKKEMPENIPGVKLISAAELKKWMDTKKNFVLLDNRVKEQYDAEKIKGAKWLLADHLLADQKLADQYKKDETIVLY